MIGAVTDLFEEVFGEAPPEAPAREAAPDAVVPGDAAVWWARAVRALAPETADAVEEAVEAGRAGGEAAFLEVVERVPLEAPDTLETARRALRRIEIWMSEAPPARRAALVSALNSTLGRVEQIEAKRPAPPQPNALHEALRAEMDTCTDHLLRHTRERAAKFRTDRAALFDGLDIAPGLRAEVQRRVDAMLGGAT